MTAISTQVEQLKQDVALLASQQLQFDDRLKKFKAPSVPATFTEAQAQAIFKMVKMGMDRVEEKLTQSHGAVHRQAIAEVRDQALGVALLGKASFTDACDMLRSAVEQLLAGTGSGVKS